MIEIALRDGLVVDGTGDPPRLADVGISGGEIVAVGDVGVAAKDLDASGLIVAPGFIDAHTHDDMQLRRDPFNREKLLQGVTTVICGNCGFSAFPASPWADVARPALDRWAPGTRSTATPRRFAHKGLVRIWLRSSATTQWADTSNLMWIAGQIVGSGLRSPTGYAKPSMRELLGVSTGLIYEPGRFSVTEDLIEIATAAAQVGGLYCTHVRDEGAGLLESIDEAITIAHQSGAGLQLSHLKTVGRENWGLVATALSKIDEAYERGVDIGFDVYPYTAGSGPFEQYFDPDDIDVERLEFVQIVHCPDFPHFEGLRVPAIATVEGCQPADVTRRIIAGPRATETVCVIFEIDEAEMRTVLGHPRAMIGSDGDSPGWGRAAPPSDRSVPSGRWPVRSRRRSV